MPFRYPNEGMASAASRLPFGGGARGCASAGARGRLIRSGASPGARRDGEGVHRPRSRRPGQAAVVSTDETACRLANDGPCFERVAESAQVFLPTILLAPRSLIGRKNRLVRRHSIRPRQPGSHARRSPSSRQATAHPGARRKRLNAVIYAAPNVGVELANCPSTSNLIIHPPSQRPARRPSEILPASSIPRLKEMRGKNVLCNKYGPHWR